MKFKYDKETGISQEPFRQYNLESKKEDTFTVKLNKKERDRFEKLKYIIQQNKDSTAIKQLAWIGAKVILDDQMKEFLEIVMNNYRKNKRSGIIKFEK